MKVEIVELRKLNYIPSGGENVVFFVENYDDLKNLPSFYRVLGNGSNVVISSHGLSEAIIKLTGDFSRVSVRGNRIIAGGGASLSSVIRSSLQAGLSGIENLTGVPATVGGAVFKNAGAFGGNICEKIDWLKVFSKGKIKRLTPKNFSYRKGPISSGEILLEVCLNLKKDLPSLVQKRMADVIAERKKRGFLDGNTSGCVFKNPGLPAGKIMDEAGVKKLSLSNIKVSSRHANVFKFSRNFLPKDFYALAERARNLVFEKKGILLEYLVELWGDFTQ